MADRKITELSAMSAGTQATGDLLTIVDVSEAAAVDKNKKITVESLFKGIPNNVGIGTTSPLRLLDINNGTHATLALTSGNAGQSSIFFADTDTNIGQIAYTHSDNVMYFRVNDAERARLDSSGRLLVGTTTEGTALADNLTVADSGNSGITIRSGSASYGSLYFSDGDSGGAGEYAGFVEYNHNDDYLGFGTGSTTRLRINSAGKVGINTSSPAATLSVDALAGNSTVCLLKSPTANAFLQLGNSANDQGYLGYQSSDMTFLTAAAERMRLDSAGNLLIATTTNGTTAVGTVIRSSGETLMSRQNGNPLIVNRLGNDGVLIDFRQANTTEGSINVSGGSVTLVGAHLTRWSQLPGGVERTEILRGSVLSNLDEMCEWGKEDNEQLNRMKVSDVEGDKNVSGVFQSWDDDDDTYVNDFYCAMTGDFVIRIAQGTTVARGDLLMSAGDGTAKPQDDDIVRSKTIAKVTSTTVSTTYSDNSYCVPCVLMAC
jgi:hypothetical protein